MDLIPEKNNGKKLTKNEVKRKKNNHIHNEIYLKANQQSCIKWNSPNNVLFFYVIQN